MSAEEVKEDTEDSGLVAVLQTAQHRTIQIVHNELAFVLVAKFVEVVDQESCQELLYKFVELLLPDHRHDDTALAGLVHNGNEVFGKPEWSVLSWPLENVDKHVRECTDQVIGGVLDRFLVVLNGLDDFIEGNETLNSFVEVAAILQVANEFDNVVNLPLSGWVERFLLGPFHFQIQLAQVFIVVQKVHFVVLIRRVEVYRSFCVPQNVVLYVGDHHILLRTVWLYRHSVGIRLLIHDGCLRPLGIETFYVISIAKGPSQVRLRGRARSETSRKSLLAIVLSGRVRVEFQAACPWGLSFQSGVEALRQRVVITGR